MNSRGAKVLAVVFFALAVECAFDGLRVENSVASPAQDNIVFCAILDAASVKSTHRIHVGPLASGGKAVGPLPGVHPLWLLPQSIDHPPEASA